MTNLKLLSKYRSEIMGFAIIWVFLCHIFPYETTFKYDILKIIADFGYAGVDIFLFVSGFGLYHGFSKYNSKKEFYKKRFLRIVPTYLFFIVLTLIFTNRFSLVNLVALFLDLGWYFPGSELPYYNWYMSAIMLLYLAFPFYINAFNKSPLKATIFTSILTLLLTIFMAYFGSINSAIFTTRIPIFLLGIYASFMLKKGDINIHYKRQICIALITFFFTFFFIRGSWLSDYKPILVWNYGFYWIPFILIVPGLLAFLTIIFDFIAKTFPMILSVLRFFGTISLEIYLIHVNEDLLAAIKSITTNQSSYFIYILLLSIIGGVIIHKLMSFKLTTNKIDKSAV